MLRELAGDVERYRTLVQQEVRPFNELAARQDAPVLVAPPVD